MDLIKDINNIIVTGRNNNEASAAIQQKVVEYICGLDYRNEEVINQSYAVVRSVFVNTIEKNLPLSAESAKAIHALLSKITLAESGLYDVALNYRDKTESSSTGAYFQEADNSINFFNETVCNTYELLMPYGQDTVRGATSRIKYFLYELAKLKHEVTHAEQYYAARQEVINEKHYLMMKQMFARTLTFPRWSKYYDQNNPDKLYKDNYYEQMVELEAYGEGYKRMIESASKISPMAVQIINSPTSTFRKLMIENQQKFSQYKTVTWKHSTNPANMEVNSHHKSTMIIDEVLPKLNKEDREFFFSRYPSLSITYNTDGSKKKLEEIEKDRIEALKKASQIRDVDKKNGEIVRVNKLYTAAIESDPTLSFEHCLQHIARLTSDSTRYYTDGGKEVTYDPDELSKELNTAGAKANMLAVYLEGAEAKDIKKIMAKYKKEIERSSKKDVIARNLADSKRMIIYKLESTLYKNAEIREAYKKEAEQAYKQRAEKEHAIEIIGKVFPGFVPRPQIGGGTLEHIELYDNYDEKLLLNKSLAEYTSQVIKQKVNATTDQEYVPIGIVREAISKLYPFDIPQEVYQEFDDKFNSGEIDLLRNKYTPAPVVESVAPVETASADKVATTGTKTTVPPIAPRNQDGMGL